MLELSSRDLKGLRTLSRKKASYLFSCLSFLIAILFFVLVFSGDLRGFLFKNGFLVAPLRKGEPLRGFFL